MTSFEECFNDQQFILMEGAIGERLKREYGITPDEIVALAGHVYNQTARNAIKELYIQYLTIGQKYNLPIMITTPTRRANRERTLQSAFKDKSVILDNVSFLKTICQESDATIFIGGLMGCKGDAYAIDEVLSAEVSYSFHSWQAELFQKANVDFLFAGIMPALQEAIGMAKAMESTGLPYIISFMIRNDGRLLDGTTINDAIVSIDSSTKRNPLCYMTNCVHPAVLSKALSHGFNQTNTVQTRFKGIQANTSPLSPEELDNCFDLKTSDSVSLAEDMMALYQQFGLKIFGGCCGTDNSHIEEIARRLKQHEI